jgi:hypothetical protein
MPDPAPSVVEAPTQCELCGRTVPGLTQHHLIPRMRQRARRIRREYGRAELAGRLLWLCRPCHDQVHAVLTEKELAARYNTREALAAHPDIARFVAWIRRRPADLKPRSRSMKRRTAG